MSYSDDDVTVAMHSMQRYRGRQKGELGAALVVVGLSADRAAQELQSRDDLIRVAHRAGASVRQLCNASGLPRKTILAILDGRPYKEAHGE